MELFLISVGIPALFVIAMSFLEGLIHETPWQEKLSKIGWDLGVLAFGVSGTVFASVEVANRFSGKMPIILGSACLGGALICQLGIAYVRKRAPITGRGALISLVLGGLAIGAPCYLVFS